MMNIVDPILFQAKINPGGIAICTPGTARESVTYGELARMVNNIGRRAHFLGLASGNVVAIAIKDKIFHAAVILGLTRLGIVTVSTRGSNLPQELGVQVVITDAPGHFENVGRIILADLIWSMGDGKPLPDERVYQIDETDICRIILTSGTTGESKGVAFTHENMLGKNARYDFVKGNRFPLSARLYCDLGLASSPGYRYLIYMLSRGGTIYYFGDSSESMVQAFNLHKIQNMIAAPSGLAEYVRFFEAHSAFQCGFDHILSSGGPLPKPLSERVRARMTAHLFCSYGATETGTVAIGPAQIIADFPSAVGFVVPGVSVEIVNDQGNVLSSKHEGTVRIRTPQTVAGYFGNPGESAEAFRGGWFYPGDIGCLTEDRMLVILGREKSVVNIGGDKVNPEVVEETLISFGAIEQAAAFVQTNELGVAELWAAIVSRSAIDESALRTYCSQKRGPAFAPHHFIQVEALPRNDMGKIERHRLSDLVKTGRS
jgi:acyl-CoA synthetase (AMP-forming)/AMP-acid ligase II